MTIYIKRNLHSRWGVNGECFINDTKVCDTVEHPTAHRPAGVYRITRCSFSRYFLQSNAPMKSVNGEISVGVYQLPGLVLHEGYDTYRRILSIVLLNIQLQLCGWFLGVNGSSHLVCSFG